MTDQDEQQKAAEEYCIKKHDREDGEFVGGHRTEGFLDGIKWRDKNPSREMVSAIIALARRGMKPDMDNRVYMLDDEILESLKRGEG